jgi:hypothetical protein
MFTIEEYEIPQEEIKLKFPDLQSSNGGLAVIREPTYQLGIK